MSKIVRIAWSFLFLAGCIPLPSHPMEPLQCMVLADTDLFEQPAVVDAAGQPIQPVGRLHEGDLVTVLEVIPDDDTGAPVILSTTVGWIKTDHGYIRTGACR